ncbi:MAG: hypothetical protein A2W91_05615 [Bacteroidetes bacterium GWF2_38_335]|nr:MAG: hypothetical protein A2W91_05615 [Bacteroidetes bacterium GWF2_38_335]
MFSQVNIDWQKSYGGTWDEYSKGVEVLSDGSYIIGCVSSSSDGDVLYPYEPDDFWVIKMDEFGEIVWQKCYGGSSADRLNDIKKTNDNGFILAGLSFSSDIDVSANYGVYDGWIVKIDSLGNIEWEKNYGGSGMDEIRSINLTNDGGYIACGYTNSTDGDVSYTNGYSDAWVIKIDSVGNLISSKVFGGPSADGDIANCILQTKDNGYIFIGNSSSEGGDVTSNNGELDLWIVKLTAIGIIDWQVSLGGSTTELGKSICEGVEDGFYVAGITYSDDFDVSNSHGSEDGWIINISATGDTVWTKTYGGSGDDEISSIKRLSNGQIITAGNSQGDCWMQRLDVEGNILWEDYYGGSEGEWMNDVEEIETGYIVTGASRSIDLDCSENNGGCDAWTIKLGDPIITVPENFRLNNINFYPNPASKIIYFNTEKEVSIKLTDLTGKQISFVNSNKLDVSNFEPGIYIIAVYDMKGNFLMTQKLVIK